jgi:hypothetical protein
VSQSFPGFKLVSGLQALIRKSTTKSKTEEWVRLKVFISKKISDIDKYTNLSTGYEAPNLIFESSTPISWCKNYYPLPNAL